ncbi:Alkane hydroxylase MAH1 [Ananas comosus]|uniref:Alkane hydroxylase MAH1 n=1 Tax=Ananas comosus TaxID=4615 RepID=A0A199W9E1_ANACO|nr:Alkane hydroxylase MAH1 [Ananas comosus]
MSFRRLLPSGSYLEILLVVLCYLFISILLLLIRHHRHRRRLRHVPFNWPVVGMLPSLAAEFHRLHDFFADALRESGCTLAFTGPWLSRMAFLLTCDPANAHHIFDSNFANYPKGPAFADTFDVLGRGILNSDAAAWRAHRRLAHALLGHRAFRSHAAATASAHVERSLVPFMDHAADARHVVDLEDVLARHAFDVTCATVLGAETACLSPSLPAVPFAEAIDAAEAALHFRHVIPPSWWKLLRWLNVGSERRLARATSAIDEFIADEISKRKQIATDRGVDLLTMYMNLPEEELTGFDRDGFLRDTALTFMLAGKDTIAASLAWFFYAVATHPEAEANILRELRALHADPAAPRKVFGADALRNCVYLGAAILESLRLFPPIPFEEKEAAVTDVLPSGAKVEKGTRIVVSLYAMARMEGVWGKDCSEYKPERWISASGKLRHEPPYKFLAFNAGPRMCLGKDLALTQLKVTAAAVIYNFCVEVVEGHEVVPENSVILHMKNGMLVRLKKRNVIDN